MQTRQSSACRLKQDVLAPLVLVFVTVQFFILTFASFVQAQNMPGETHAQRMVITAWWLLPEVLTACELNASLCALTPEEKKALDKVRAFFPEAHRTTFVEFVSEKEVDGLFKAGHGPHRLAVTNSAPGSTIYFNSDLIESNDFTLATFVSILAHELAHHAGYQDIEEAFLDRFGNKIAAVFTANSQLVDAESIGMPGIQLLTFQRIVSPYTYETMGKPPKLLLIPTLVAIGPNMVIPLSGTLVRTTECYFGASMAQMWTSGLRWTGVVDVRAVGEKQIAAEIEEQHICRSEGQELVISSRFRIHLGLRTGENGAFLLSGITGVSDFGGAQLETDASPVLLSLTTSRYPDPGLVTIRDIAANAEQLKAGETWKVEAEVETRADWKPNSCSLVISSDEFSSFYGSGRKYSFESSTKECKWKKLANRRYRVVATYRFPNGAPARTYHLAGIGFGIENNMRVAYALPTKRLNLRLISSEISGRHAGPAKVSIVVGDKSVSPEQPGILPYQWCHRFNIQARLESKAGLLQSHVWYRITYSDPEMKPVVLVDRLTNQWGRLWRSQAIQDGDETIYDHSLNITEDFLGPAHFDKIEILRMTLMTDDLKETVFDFPAGQVGLKVLFPSASCEMN